MKKILIIFFGLILGCNLASAKGVSCWEETDTTFNPDTVSKMQNVLGNDTTIARVKTILRGISIANGTIVDIPLANYITSTKSSGKNTYTVYLEGNNYYSGSSNSSYVFYVSPRMCSYSLDRTQSMCSDSWYSNRINIYQYSSENILVAFGWLYIHTYCIVNEGSSGGGGGGATGSVNFIIKATS